MATQYVSSNKYNAVAQWAAATPYAPGAIVRQLASQASSYQAVGVNISAVGSGYSNGTFTCSVVGGTATTTAQLSVVIAGGVTTAPTTIVTPGVYSALPANTVAVSGLSGGVSAAFNLAWGTTERCFRTANGGTSGNGEPTWVLSAGAAQPSDGTIADWLEVTGQAIYGWSAPHAKYGNALLPGWLAAGDVMYVGDQHSQTWSLTGQAYSYPGTPSQPNYILCVPETTSPPVALSTGATVSLTTSFVLFLGTGHVYHYGMTYSNGSGSTGGILSVPGVDIPTAHRMENCQIKLAATATVTQQLQITNGGYLELINSQITLGRLGANIIMQDGAFVWRDTANALLGAGANAAGLIHPSIGSQIGYCVLRNLDLSAITSGAIVNPTTGQIAGSLFVEIDHCKLASSTTAITGASGSSYGSGQVDLLNCDSGGAYYREEHYNYAGSIVQDTTVVRSSGSSDGTNAMSWKATSSAGALFAFPLYSPDLYVWNDATGSSMNASVEIVNDGSTLSASDLWLDVNYLGSNASPLGSMSNSKAPVLASLQGNAGSAYPISTVTWTTTGLASPVKQTLSVNFTPQMKGPIRLRLAIAKPSKTIWIDAIVTVV